MTISILAGCLNNRPDLLDLLLVEDDAETPDNSAAENAEPDDAAPDNPVATQIRPSRPDVALELARLVLDAAVPPAIAKRLDARKTIALVLQAPARDWVTPLKFAVEHRWPHAFVDARDGSSRGVHKSTVGNENVAARLVVGARFIGISHNPEACLPSALLTVADARASV